MVGGLALITCQNGPLCKNTLSKMLPIGDRQLCIAAHCSSRRTQSTSLTRVSRVADESSCLGKQAWEDDNGQEEQDRVGERTGWTLRVHGVRRNNQHKRH
jgi:hypothetical protein